MWYFVRAPYVPDTMRNKWPLPPSSQILLQMQPSIVTLQFFFLLEYLIVTVSNILSSDGTGGEKVSYPYKMKIHNIPL